MFVKVRHESSAKTSRLRRLTEFHDIVYREAPRPNDGASAADHGAGQRRHGNVSALPDDVLLFRYSALTFNGHRIHYDRRYVTEVEGYPGLIVHGPLIATLLLDLLRHKRPDAECGEFRFRAVRPTFDINPSPCAARRIRTANIHLWAGTMRAG